MAEAAVDRTSPHRPRVGPVPLALLFLGLALRVGLILATPHYQAIYDAGDYVRLARQIAGGHDMTTYAPTWHHGWAAFRPPGYPLFLAGVVKLGGGLTWMRLAGALLGTASVGLFGLLGRELFDRRAGLAAMAIAAVYPSFVLLDSVLYSEVLFLPLLLSALLCAIRAVRRASWWWAVGAGAMSGAVAEVRPNGFLVIVAVVVIAIPALAKGRHTDRGSVVIRWLLPAAATGFAMLLVMTPWTVRNEVRLHAFIPSTDAAGFDLAGTFNAADARDGAYPGTLVPPTLVQQYRPIFADVALDEPQINAALGREARTYAEHHPGFVAKVMAANTARTFGVSQPSWAASQAALMNIGRATGYAWWFGWWLLVAAGLLGIRRAWRRIPIGLVVLAVVFWVPTSLTAAGDPRYREPVEVAVVLVAALGLAELIGRHRSPA